MDPIGPWYTPYNRLAATAGITTTFQTVTPTSTSTDPASHHLTLTAVNTQTVPSTSTSQLLLQAAAHPTVTLAGQSFNPGGFLSTPTAVGYDVFTPFFHHTNSKQTSPYATQHPQPIAQAQVVTTSKPSSPVESDNPALRSSYTSPQQNDTFFEHQAAATSPTTGNWSLSQPTNTQLSSPFGILPHESVAVSSPPGPPSTTKSANVVTYESPFVTHYTSNGTTVAGTDSKTDDWTNADPAKKNGEQSPIDNSNNSIKCIVTESSISGAHTFFQGASAFDSDGLSTSYSTDDQSATNTPAVQSSLHHQSCIVSTPNITPANKEYRISQLPSQSPVPTTIYLNVTPQEKQAVPVTGNHNEHTGPDQGHESSQSSPISFSIMDSRNLNYNSNGNSNKQQASNGVVQQFHVLSQAPQAQQQPSSCRHYSNSTDTEYHHPARSKSAASTDSAYSSNTSQNGPDCAVVVPRRPSPLQAHSQASPLGHVPSPATYPMYNSPMASMSSPSPLQQQHGDGAASTPYKTGSVQQQMTPPSPLDVTVTRPPSQQGQVVYSSVITRALGAADNKTSYNTDASSRASFDGSQDFAQSKQLCWESEAQQQSDDLRKFPNTNYLTTDGSESGVLANQQMQRILTVADNQPSCLESGQITLQDLSSCRGDPMNIVKNLQTTEHESDELKQVDEQHHQAVVLGVKRKNLDKVDGDLSTTSDYLSRIPPPAHHNIVVNQPQQQHNGFLEFERWNLALPHAKIITTGPGVFTAQQSQQQPVLQTHQTVNIAANSVVHQQQPMLVAQHTVPTVSYFPAFHLTPNTQHVAPLHQQQQQQHHPQHHPHIPHHSQELHTTLEISSLGISESNACHQPIPCTPDSMQDSKQHVVVPNVEEDLDFLQQLEVSAAAAANAQQSVNPDPKRAANNFPNTGFMTSYLKFLQGEKDPSPPPATRGGRRASWNSRRPYVSAESNGGIGSQPPTSSDKSKDVPTIDYANDPRYFPLPKERKKQRFDSSDDGFSSDDELPPFGSKRSERKAATADGACQVGSNAVEAPVPKKVTEAKKKGRPIKPGGPTDRKRKAAEAAAAAAAAAASGGILLPPLDAPGKRKKVPQLPRRESSRRKAKEKTSVKEILDSQQTADPYDVEEEPGDSDSDPAWTPAAKSVGDDEDKRKKRGRPVISKRKKLFDANHREQVVVGPKRPGRKRRHAIDPNARSNAIKLSCKIDEKLLASVSDEDIDISPFKHSTIGDAQDASGEFVVIKSDLDQEYPPLWRIDGKTLLQKYEPFQANGRTLYRNISTYSGWAPQNRHIYQQVPVKFWEQSKVDTIVEFLREEMIIDDSECISKFMKDTEKYQDNFEVYIQTLISQALDSNFLTEIFQEQDDYFLLNVKTVDEITEERKQRLLSTTNWGQNVVTALSTWPCINVLRDNISDYKGKSCAGCNRTKIHARVLLYGQPYNSTTLEGSPPDPQVPQEKDFLFCRLCQTKVALFNKVAHQKYLMFLECARRVADKRLADPHKDTTIILNELLADEAWLNQLFREVRSIWAEIDTIQQQAKKKANFAAANVNVNISTNPNSGENAVASTTHILKVPGASQLSNESQAISYNDQMGSNLS